MGKNKKKRDKIYTGQDAAITQPIITRISAVNRSKTGQWWFEHQKMVKTIAKIGGVVLAVIIIILEIINVASGHGF
jgi:hypothetical protein